MVDMITFFAYFALVCLMIFIFAAICVLAYFAIKSKKRITPPNCPIVENFNTPLTGGYYFGLELEAKKIKFMGKSRYRVKFVPFGRFYDIEKERYTEELKVYDIILEQGMRIEKIVGEPHKTRSTIVYLSPSTDDIPLHYKESELGKWVSRKITVEGVRNMFVKDVNKIKNAIAKYIIDTTHLPEQIVMGNVEDIIKNVLARMKTEEEKRPGYGRLPGR